jgi:hypothetical protein
MIYTGKRLAEMQSNADRREFVKGLTDSDKVHLSALAAGFISTRLLLKAFKK